MLTVPPLERLLEDVDPAERPAGPLQIMPADALFEPNPLVPTLVHGIESADAWERVGHDLREAVGGRAAAWLVGGATPRRVTLDEAAQARQDHTALYLPAVGAECAERSLAGLRALVHRLRAPGGCPWDREQTPASLIKYIIEEAYEVADAIRLEGPAAVAEELGDLLLQVFLQAEIAQESGQFSLNDVVEQISKKLLRRHPHVFGDVQVSGAAEVERNWERLKGAEKSDRRSALDGIPRGLPALLAAQEIQRKLKRAGFDWPDRSGVDAKLREELAELSAATTPEQAAAELGDVLFILSRLALDLGVDAEEALRGANRRVQERFRYVEDRLRERGLTVGEVPLDESLALWNQAKTAHDRTR